MLDTSGDDFMMVFTLDMGKVTTLLSPTSGFESVSFCLGEVVGEATATAGEVGAAESFDAMTTARRG
jgi:hypothetical protein